MHTPVSLAATAHPTPPPAAAAAAPNQTADAQACASALLDVLPMVMNVLRLGMRNQVGEGLSVPQFRCLNYIARHPGASVSQVAAFLGVSLPTASAMIDRLVRGGHVAAATAEEDRRRSRLDLSAGGHRLVERIRRGARRELAEALGHRPAAELEALVDGLTVLRNAFEPR